MKNHIYQLVDFAIETASLIAGIKSAHDTGEPSAGYAVSEFLNDRLHNLVNRFSSERQSKRIRTVTQYALEGIRHRLENDEELRNDGFFEQTIDRSCAEEAFEAVLLKARDEPEEKKIPYLGKLFENGCFDSSIDSGSLHFLSKESENLTYRQLCIIKIANEMRERRFPLRGESFGNFFTHKEVRHNTTPEQFSTLAECAALCDKKYVMFNFSSTPGIELDISRFLIPNTMRSLTTGTMMYEHMNLRLIPEADVLPVIEALS